MTIYQLEPGDLEKGDGLTYAMEDPADDLDCTVISDETEWACDGESETEVVNVVFLDAGDSYSKGSTDWLPLSAFREFTDYIAQESDGI